MTDYLNIILKSAINSLELLTSVNLFILYIFLSFGIFQFLAGQAQSVEGKLKMWKYNSYAFYLLFILMQLSAYIRNNPDRWLWAAIVICLLATLLFLKIRAEERNEKDKAVEVQFTNNRN